MSELMRRFSDCYSRLYAGELSLEPSELRLAVMDVFDDPTKNLEPETASYLLTCRDYLNRERQDVLSSDREVLAFMLALMSIDAKFKESVAKAVV